MLRLLLKLLIEWERGLAWKRQRCMVEDEFRGVGSSMKFKVRVDGVERVVHTKRKDRELRKGGGSG